MTARTALRLGWSLVGLAVLLVLTAVGLTIAGIWTVGPDSERLGGTAVVLFFVGMPLGFGGVGLLVVAE